MPAAYSPTGGSSKPTTARRKASGICVRMPAPSPVPASEPIAPRCSRLRSAVSARSMMSCPASPRSVATIARPQASFSKAGLYMPCFWGKPGMPDCAVVLASGEALRRGLDAISTVLTLMLKMGRRRPVLQGRSVSYFVATVLVAVPRSASDVGGSLTSTKSSVFCDCTVPSGFHSRPGT